MWFLPHSTVLRIEHRRRRERHCDDAVVPSSAGRHPRMVATANTIVNGSTASTSEARKADVMVGAAVAHENIEYPY